MSKIDLDIVAQRYVIQESLQTGGMTTVYRARDLATDELVAIKRFDRDRHLPEIEREAFVREVDALQNLKHPNIVRMLDSGEDDNGSFYVVLELMRHDLVHERQADGAPFAGWDDYADLVIVPLVEALAYAHEMDIAHRDVKPANVLIDRDGKVKLADFGISKLKRTLQPRITLNDFMSPPFCPPEPDTGGYTYCRDVYSIGVLCIWGLSADHIHDRASVLAGLNYFDAPPEIVEIVRRAVSTDPKDRQQSAALLAAELSRVQTKRQRVWQAQDRPACAIGLTKSAREIIADELETNDVNAINKFVTEDINVDGFIQRYVDNPGKHNERVVPEHYSILGSSLRYHVARNDKGFDNLSIISVFRPEPHFLQRDREQSMPAPLTFKLDVRVGVIPLSQALDTIERALEAFDQEQANENRRSRETALFDAWSNVLEAKLRYERDLIEPIRFSVAGINGSLITLDVDGGTQDIEVGQGRVVYTESGPYYRCDVWDVSDSTVTLNCPGISLADFPKQGEAKLDQFALQIAVERQRDAIGRIRTGATPNSSLKNLLIDPSSAEPPGKDYLLSDETLKMLDESKCAALKAALTVPELLLVEGPPGTGKTHFIVGLIQEELRRKPDARILMASQTHVAIDNALERLATHHPYLPMIRIAREGSQAVADSSDPYRLSRQLKSWRDEVVKLSNKAMEDWASNHGLDPIEIQLGSLVRQIVGYRERIDRLRERIKEEEDRKSGMTKLKAAMPHAEYEVEFERVISDLQDLRERLQADRVGLELIENQLKGIARDSKDLLDLPLEEQVEWAANLLGDSKEEQQAERLLLLQSEWLDRFGTAKRFVQPLVHRSAVVAATCIGLASLEEASEVDFDLCIIDEASKATAMESCVPMARARRWVLIGDSRQLPPFREEVLARKELRELYDLDTADVGESLFERLRQKLPAANRVMLQTQYRMVEPIGRLISNCFYEGKLASDRKEINTNLCSLTGYAVNWMSTRKLPKKSEQLDGKSFINTAEAEQILNLVADLDDSLKESGCTEVYSVLVLSAYGSQVRNLDRRFRQVRHQLKHLTVECCTVDRVQGREAHAVFFSVTRSNTEHRAGFLRALERINVALSRAKDLLMIVGDNEFVEHAPGAEPLQNVLSHMRNWPSECFQAVLEPDREGGKK